MHAGSQAIEAGAHIGHTGSSPDAHTRRQPHHVRKPLIGRREQHRIGAATDARGGIGFAWMPAPRAIRLSGSLRLNCQA